MPMDVDYLPARLRRLLADSGSGIAWHPEDASFTYTYERPYLLQPSLLGFLSFGLLETESFTLGASITAAKHSSQYTAIQSRRNAAQKMKPGDTANKRPHKTDAGKGSKAICRVGNVLRSPSA